MAVVQDAAGLATVLNGGDNSSPFTSAVELAAAFNRGAALAKPLEQAASTQACPDAARSVGAAVEGASFSSVSLTSSFAASISTAANPLNASTGSTTCGGPPHGVKAVCGKRAKMEDAFAVQTNFFDLPPDFEVSPQNKLPARIASQFEDDYSPCCSPMGTALAGEQSLGGSSLGSDSSTTPDTLHFFGVFDGHGGIDCAQHCANRLHHHLAQGLHTAISPAQLAEGVLQCTQRVGKSGKWSIAVQEADQATELQPDDLDLSVIGGEAPSELQLPPKPPPTQISSSTDTTTSTATEATSVQTDADLCLSDSSSAASSGCDSGAGSSVSVSAPSSISTLLEDALRRAFLDTDAEFANDCCASMVGSTAVVAVLGNKRMWIANCGDSRAVLCRNGKAIQLTDDHKPEREDEAERVEKAGGQVLYWNGHRVMGVLAMSRAIGDHGLRPYVIAEPEITVVSRTEDDDFLLLASDGLWDVMSNSEAANLALRCMSRAWEKGASRKAAARVAAAVMTKAAVDRGSKDNVTVVIVDLKCPRVPTAAAVAGVGGTPLPQPVARAQHGATCLPCAEAAAKELGGRQQ